MSLRYSIETRIPAAVDFDGSVIRYSLNVTGHSFFLGDAEMKRQSMAEQLVSSLTTKRGNARILERGKPITDWQGLSLVNAAGEPCTYSGGIGF